MKKFRVELAFAARGSPGGFSRPSLEIAVVRVPRGSHPANLVRFPMYKKTVLNPGLR